MSGTPLRSGDPCPACGDPVSVSVPPASDVPASINWSKVCRIGDGHAAHPSWLAYHRPADDSSNP